MNLTRRIFDRYRKRSRDKKYKLFFKLMNPKLGDRTLNVGASCSKYAEGQQFEDVYPWQAQVTGGGINKEELLAYKEDYPEVSLAIFDACKLPFKDKSFDIIFSNAVIEHMETYERQKQMAKEIMRVGKQWFITTPNFWFPFELHFRLPFIHYFPKNIQILIKKFIGGRYPCGCYPKDLRLLRPKEMKILFSGSKIILCRATIIPETIIQYFGKN